MYIRIHSFSSATIHFLIGLPIIHTTDILKLRDSKDRRKQTIRSPTKEQYYTRFIDLWAPNFGPQKILPIFDLQESGVGSPQST